MVFKVKYLHQNMSTILITYQKLNYSFTKPSRSAKPFSYKWTVIKPVK